MQPGAEQTSEAWTLPGLHGALFTRLASTRPGSVLDIGCGPGGWLGRWASAGVTRLAGVDRDIGGYAGPQARLICANLDLDEVDLGGERFDLVSAVEVVEHLENPGRLFRFAARQLAPGGRFLLTTPNVLSTAARLRLLLTGRVPFFDEKSDPTHLIPVLPRTVEILAKRNGLELVERWHYPERGSSAMRPALTALARLLPLIPEHAPGDISCYLLERGHG